MVHEGRVYHGYTVYGERSRRPVGTVWAETLFGAYDAALTLYGTWATVTPAAYNEREWEDALDAEARATHEDNKLVRAVARAKRLDALADRIMAKLPWLYPTREK